MEPILPLRAIAFQCLFLLVAIALEAAVLRQWLRQPFKTSIEYAATVNLFTASLGWFAVLGIEPLLSDAFKQQVISYVLFDRFFGDTWDTRIIVFLLMAAVLAFFITFFIKMKGLEGLQWLLGVQQPQQPKQTSQTLTRQQKYDRARRGGLAIAAPSRQAMAVLQANALSFSAILILLLIRAAIVRF
ncbi:MAG: filament integrity protein FraC [Cyanobacteria bacterium P01_A01_bin.123]